MKLLQTIKTVEAIEPGVIKDNAAWTGIAIDTLGFTSARVVVQLGATDIAMAALKLTECETSGGSYTDVPDGDYSVDGTLPASTDDNKFFAIHVSLPGRKRFLKIAATAGDGAAGTYASAWCDLGDGGVTPSNVTDRGFAQELFC